MALDSSKKLLILYILEILKGLTDMMTDKALMQLFSSAVLTEEAVPHTEDYSK